MLAFGPVPSRRLGRSLGINNIPPKICPYSCIYCQLGRTNQESVDRQTFHELDVVLEEVRAKVAASRQAGEPIDYLSFVPDGEPTLDANLGRTIRALRPLGIPVAVISNASLIDREDVRADLAEADWVSLKVDTVSEELWQKIDRPHGRLRLQPILEGMHTFAADFTGELTTETMLLAELNDTETELRAISGLVRELAPNVAYLSAPTRPPAEAWVRPASEEAIARAFEIFRAAHEHVELLVGYEGDAFATTGDPKEDLLSITAVHPMREAAVRRLMDRAGGDWEQVEELIREGQLVEARYGTHRYFLRPIKRPTQPSPGEAAKQQAQE
jgi:wyosine [tRNA(Phe)-imidazoG37] synthetase (radical SAM superfamily)